MKKRRRAFIVEKVSGNEWRDSIESLNEEDILLLRCGKVLLLKSTNKSYPLKVFS